MIVIGSTAIKHHFPDFPREPRDKDYAKLDGEPIKTATREEYPIPLLCVRHKGYGNGDQYATPNELYTLKLSHCFWDIHWEKTMFDLVWLKKKGCVVEEELFRRLYDYWVGIHGKKKVANYNLKADEFFDNALDNQHSHDDIHKIIKNPPTFTKILVDEVKCSRELFWELPHEERISLTMEECMVMAYERLNGRDYRSAYIAQLKDFFLNHAPVYQARHIAEHYDEVRKPLFNYVEKINHELNRTNSKT